MEDNAAKIDEDKMGEASFLMVITGGLQATGATTVFCENHSRKSS